MLDFEQFDSLMLISTKEDNILMKRNKLTGQEEPTTLNPPAILKPVLGPFTLMAFKLISSIFQLLSVLFNSKCSVHIHINENFVIYVFRREKKILVSFLYLMVYVFIVKVIINVIDFIFYINII